MCRGGIRGRRVVVGEGEMPVPGRDGSLKSYVDVSAQGKPRELEGGRVDHRDLRHIYNVRAGQPLLERIPPVPGKPGKTVFGEAVAPPGPKDVALRVGPGTEISKRNPNLLVAAIDGAVKVGPDGLMEVRGARVVRGDVDYATGNISFVGSLRITGTVRAGFAVEVGGDLAVGGGVEDARVRCGGDLTIAGGAVGSQNGRLTAGGSVKVHHLEGFGVKAGGDVSVAEDALHSRIEAEGVVRAKTIVGGMVVAGGGVESAVVGATAETKTILDMGGVYRLRLRREETLRKMGRYAMDLAAKKKEMFTLVSEGMDDAGNLRPEQAAELLKMKKARTALRAEHVRLAKEIEVLDGKLKTAPRPTIRTRRMYPNTIVRFGPLERTVNEEMRNVAISASGDRITFSRRN